MQTESDDITAPATTETPSTSTDKGKSKHKLSLKSPFKSLKRTGSLKSGESGGVAKAVAKFRKKSKKEEADVGSSTGSISADDITTKDEVKKKRDVAATLVRKLSGLARSFSTEADPPALSLPPQEDDSRSGSILEDAPSTSPHMSTASSQDVDPPASEVIAAEHPVSTLPFAKSSWTKKVSSEPEFPVEIRSESAQKRRLSFVPQPSGSEEPEAGSVPAAVGVLSRQGSFHSIVDSVTHRTDSEEEIMPAYGDILSPSPMPINMGAETSHAVATGGVERREHLYKILVIGELGTGKTSIIKRYVHQFFSDHYRATIGVDFALKVLNWDSNTVIRLQLWDIAGQERYGSMTRVYYKEAVGAFIVFDVTRLATFEAVVKWKSDLDSKVQLPDGSPIPCILLANKCEQQKEGIVNVPTKMDEFCKEKGFVGWFETSAKENINIDEAARSLVTKILLNEKIIQSTDGSDGEKFTLEHRIANGADTQNGGGKSCSC